MGLAMAQQADDGSESAALAGQQVAALTARLARLETQLAVARRRARALAAGAALLAVLLTGTATLAGRYWIAAGMARLAARPQLEALSQRVDALDHVAATLSARLTRLGDDSARRGEALALIGGTVPDGRVDAERPSPPGLQDAALRLRAIADTAREAADWRLAGHGAFAAGRFVEAAMAFGREAQADSGAPASGSPAAESQAMARLNQAIAWGRAGRPPEEDAALDTLITTFADHADGKARAIAGEAMARKAARLAGGENWPEALALSDQALARLDVTTPADGGTALARAMVGRAEILVRLGRWDDARSQAAAVIARFEPLWQADLRAEIGRAQLAAGRARAGAGEGEAALRDFDAVERRFGGATQPVLRQLVATALVEKGAVLAGLGRSPAAQAALDDGLERLGQFQPLLPAVVGRALSLKAKLVEAAGGDAAGLYDRIIALGSADGGLRSLLLGALAAKAQGAARLGRLDAAVASADAVLVRFGADGDDDAHQAVAAMLALKAECLSAAGAASEAVAALDDLSRRFTTDAAPWAQGRVARALVAKAELLAADGEDESALTAFDEALVRVALLAQASDRADLDARARVGRGLALGRLGRDGEAVQALDQAAGLLAAAVGPVPRRQLARALVGKAAMLGRRGLLAEQLAAYDGVRRRFAAANRDPILAALVAQASVDKAAALVGAGRLADAVGVYDGLLRQAGAAALPGNAASADLRPLRDLLAPALVSRAVTLGQLGRSKDELDGYDGVLRRFGDDSSRPVRLAVARALVNKGFVSGRLGKAEAEIAAYDQVIARLDRVEGDDEGEQLALALANKGVALGRAGKVAAEIAAYDALIARFGAAARPALRVQVARALLFKAETLGQGGHQRQALAAYEEVVARVADSDEPAIRDLVAPALLGRAAALVRLGRFADAQAAYDQCARQLAARPAVTTPEQLARAVGGAGWAAYRQEDWAGFQERTERALTLTPHADWLLANRALALLVTGHGAGEVLAAYGEAWKAAGGLEHWQGGALHDLEEHARTHDGAVSADLLAKVAAFGGDLARQ